MSHCFPEKWCSAMFSTLDRIDIVTRGADGRKQYVQTDHRTAEEIEQEPELSILFAVIRVLNGIQMTETGASEPVVIYIAQSQPPEFLRSAIRAAGGRVAIGKNAQPMADVAAAPPLGDVINSAFTGLARRVAAEHRVELNVAGLEVVERMLAAQ